MQHADKKDSRKNKDRPLPDTNTNAELPEANVSEDGHCITTQDGEMARPNSGGPCKDGRDSK